METIEEVLSKNGEALCPVRGCSMLPLLHAGEDTVRLTVLRGLPAKNDIVLYRRADGDLVLHRVIRVLRRGVICCGDNQTKTEYVPASFLLARAVGFIRAGVYTDFTDPSYLAYVAEHCRTLRGRKIEAPTDRYGEWRTLLVFLRAAGESTAQAPVVPATVAYAKLLALAFRQGVLAEIFPLIDEKLCPPDVYARYRQKASLPEPQTRLSRCFYRRYRGNAETGDDALCRVLFDIRAEDVPTAVFARLEGDVTKKKARFLRRVFPPVGDLKAAYPILYDYPVLLPVLWVWRGIRWAFRPKAR